MRRVLFLLVLLLVVVVGCRTAEDSKEASTSIVISTEALTATPNPNVADDDDPFYAPDFSLQTADGKDYTLSTLQGQWVILNFWATWCEPCVAEIPMLNTLAGDFAGELVVLGINMRETPQEIAIFQADTVSLDYPVLINPTDSVLLDYLVQGLPQTLVIDPNGEIVWRSFGQLDDEAFPTLIDSFISNDA